MYPDFEKTKIIDNVVYCNIGQSLQLNSFGFSFNDINDVKLNNNISLCIAENVLTYSNASNLLFLTTLKIYFPFSQIKLRMVDASMLIY